MNEPIKKAIAKGALVTGLMLHPINSHSYYVEKIYLPNNINIENEIKSAVKPEHFKIAKKIWNTRAYDIDDGDMISEALLRYEEFEEQYKEIKDSKQFYIINNINMGIAEYLTFLDTLEKERILLRVKERIEEELEKDPMNLDLLELKVINASIRYQMYDLSGYYKSRSYEEMRKQGRAEIKNLHLKWKSVADELTELNEKFSNLKKNKKEIKKMTTIFNYSNSQKKEKVKEIEERLHEEMISIEVDRSYDFYDWLR